jgi:S1-C subfamily serine protease
MPLLSQAQAQRRTTFIKEPTGWFGVRITDQVMMDAQGNAFFDSYPVVEDVTPNSPAARAGVLPGDVLLTFNSHDMRGGSVELSKWLQAGAKFELRIRRNDVTRVLKGRLAKRPDDWDQNIVFSLTVPERLAQRGSSVSRGSIERATQVRTRVPAAEPLPTVLTPALGFGGGVYPFAGAEFTRLNPDLCEALGVKPEGVFVTNVLEGSLARNAGLRGGDIILRADNSKVNSPVDLVRVIAAADERDRSIDLLIMRKHQLQSLTLRW